MPWFGWAPSCVDVHAPALRHACRVHNRTPESLAIFAMSPAWTESEHRLLQQLLAHKLDPHPETAKAVLCLCAQWCGVCREFRAVFEAAHAHFPDFLFEFVDVEDESALDELDIETFPTLLLGTADRIVFAGPILPQAGTLERHLRLLADH